jgi:hypothetical protein
MDLKLTGKIALVTGSTAAKCGMLTKYSSRRKARVWTGGLLIAAGIAAVCLVLIYQLYQPVKIEGNSMTPLLSDHESDCYKQACLPFRADSSRRCCGLPLSA